MRGVLAERAVAGQSRINALLRAKEDGGTDWRELSDALPHVRAWAVTSMSARRFPTDPGQFDLVIIDEAGQYTIPSIVPLLFRAKRSLVIGDPVVFSLVADRYQSPRSFDWADRQQDLWNVAITRARSQLVVVGDGKVWDRHGGVSTELRLAAQDAVTYTGTSGLADELTERLYDALSTVPGATVELDVMINGHQADAVLTRRGHRRAVMIDRGPITDADPAAHLQRMLCRRRLLGDDSIRLPAWMLFNEPAAVRRWIEGS